MRKQASLYLDFRVSRDSAAQATGLIAGALGAAPVASVLIRYGEEDLSSDDSGLRQVIAEVQKHGVAALLEIPVNHALELGADGVHVPWSKDVVARLRDARRTAGAGAIVGADAGRSRHDAMEIGEAGADYVAFGIPAHVEDRARAAERQLEFTEWWSQIFEIPCVAFDVPDEEHARRLAGAGADFVAVEIAAGDAINDIQARVRRFAEAVSSSEVAL